MHCFDEKNKNTHLLSVLSLELFLTIFFLLTLTLVVHVHFLFTRFYIRVNKTVPVAC